MEICIIKRFTRFSIDKQAYLPSCHQVAELVQPVGRRLAAYPAFAFALAVVVLASRHKAAAADVVKLVAVPALAAFRVLAAGSCRPFVGRQTVRVERRVVGKRRESS